MNLDDNAKRVERMIFRLQDDGCFVLIVVVAFVFWAHYIVSRIYAFVSIFYSTRVVEGYSTYREKRGHGVCKRIYLTLHLVVHTIRK